MKEKLDVLIKLQEIEFESRRLEKESQAIPQAITALDEQLKSAEVEVLTARNTIEKLNKQYRDHEGNVQMNMPRIAKKQAQMRQAKTNKEYQSLIKEIEGLKGMNSETEDRMLEILDQMDSLETALAEAESIFKLACNEIDQEKKNLQQKNEQIKARFSEIENEREDIATQADPQLLKEYNRIKKMMSDNVAIVPVENAACKGCFTNIMPQLFNELQRNDRMRHCPRCERIIYWKGNSTADDDTNDKAENT